MLPQKIFSFVLAKLFRRRDLLTGFKAHMDTNEAKMILGVRRATRDEVERSYKRLMLINHPDHNGSEYLASKINDAKNLLAAKTNK